MRARKYLSIVCARGGALTLTTMLFADEIRSTREVDAATRKAHKPTRKHRTAAVAVIEELSCEFCADCRGCDPGSKAEMRRVAVTAVAFVLAGGF